MPLTIRAVSANRHEMKFEKAVESEMVVYTKVGHRKAILTFLVMKGDFVLRAVSGAPGPVKASQTGEVLRPRYASLIPKE